MLLFYLFKNLFEEVGLYHQIGMVGDMYFGDGALKIVDVYLLQALVHLE